MYQSCLDMGVWPCTVQAKLPVTPVGVWHRLWLQIWIPVVELLFSTNQLRPGTLLRDRPKLFFLSLFQLWICLGRVLSHFFLSYYVASLSPLRSSLSKRLHDAWGEGIHWKLWEASLIQYCSLDECHGNRLWARCPVLYVWAAPVADCIRCCCHSRDRRSVAFEQPFTALAMAVRAHLHWRLADPGHTTFFTNAVLLCPIPLRLIQPAHKLAKHCSRKKKSQQHS